MSSPTPSSPHGIDLSRARLGILGGSGLYAMEGLEDIQELMIETPYGAPSDALRLGRIGDLEVVFLARHGRHHSHTPSEVPYQANLWALRSLGVRWILSLSAVGLPAGAISAPRHAGARSIHRSHPPKAADAVW